jgi:hypothetical protein
MRIVPLALPPTRPASHETDAPSTSEQPVSTSNHVETNTASEATKLRVVTKSVSTGHSLPRVRIASTQSPYSTTSPVGVALQPMPHDASQPTDADLARWFTPLNQVGILPQPEPGDLPRDYSGKLFAIDDQPRRKAWPEREFNWEAPELWHQPFYFDDVPLERYGQSIWPARQAWLSGLKFYMTFPLLPVKLWADPPYSKVASFGYYRVGADNPAVRQKSRLPHGFGLWGYGYAPGAGSQWYVPPSPAWTTTPQ